MAVIDKNTNVPMHAQLYQILQKRIAEGVYSVNSVMPSEADIQSEFEVSRITVRRAVSDLERDGYVRKKRGSGTIILPQKTYHDRFQFTGYSEDAIAHGNHPGSIVLECVDIPADIRVSEMLKVEPGETVTYLKRLRLLNGQINGLHETYISHRYDFRIRITDFDSMTSLYDYYDKHGIVLDSADESISAKMPSPTIRKELYMEENQPVFYRERVTYDSKGGVVEYSRNYYRADDYNYFVHLTKDKVN